MCSDVFFFLLLFRAPPSFTLFPYTTLFRSEGARKAGERDLRMPVVAKIGLFDPNGETGRLLETLRSEEHTSELQSHSDLVCRLLLEKKKKTTISNTSREIDRDTIDKNTTAS